MRQNEPLRKTFDYEQLFKEVYFHLTIDEDLVVNYGIDRAGVSNRARVEFGDQKLASSATQDLYEALFRAFMKAYAELIASDSPRIDATLPARKLDSAFLDPRTYFPLDKSQLHDANLRPFSEKLKLSWVKGMNWERKTIYVPTDLVYFSEPNNFGLFRSCPVHRATSCGLAAHVDLDEAIRLSLIDLIKRDAIMRNWFSRETPPRIDLRVLPNPYKKLVVKRVHELKRRGRELYLLQLPSEYGAVFLAIIVSRNSNRFPLFVCGSGVTLGTDYERAAFRAIEEAEKNFFEAKKLRARIIEPEDVETPDDHAHLYHCMVESRHTRYSYADMLKWLLSGPVTEITPNKNQTIESLLRELEVVLVCLDEPNDRYRVVKAFSPVIVPMGYGYGMSYFSHPNVYTRLSREELLFPHYFN